MPSPRTNSEFIDSAVVGRLSRIDLTARHPMLGSVTGMHRSASRGSSVEFAEYRKYVPGDDIRHIDWHVHARTDKYFIKEFEADTNLRCHLIMDTSASMGFEGDHGTKFAYARKLAATIAYLLIQQGDAVGLTTFDKKTVLDIPARRSPVHLSGIFQTLGKVEPTGQTELVSALHEAAERVSPRALIVVISDFFTDVEPLLAGFQHMRFRKQDLVVFHLLDPKEINFKFDRPVRFQDMESSTAIVTDPSVVKNGYFKALETYLNDMKRGCAENGVDYQRVTTDQDYEKVLASFLLERVAKKKAGHRK